MSSLRQQMIELMVLKGFALNTQKSYLHHITQLAKYFHRSPDKIDEEQLRQYLLYCHQVKQWSYSSCRQFIHAARFMFDRVLEKPISKGKLPFPKREEKIPELLSRGEVCRIIECCSDLKYQTELKFAYATGMRVSEIGQLMVRDLDGERNTIRVRHGTKQALLGEPATYGHDKLIDYLGRYTRRIALTPNRLIDFKNNQVRLNYRDYRDGQRKVLTLSSEELLRRYALHILPKASASCLRPLPTSL